MRTIHFHAIAASMLLALATSSPAKDQDTRILNTLEVQRMVARAEPADNARLASHFNALAERAVAEARNHTAMSQSFAGNPSRSLGTGMSAHCTRLADLHTQEGTTLRELAAYHQKLAAGGLGTVPPDAARFQGGEGAPTPSAKELNALAAGARTSADHHSLEEYFLTLARRYTTEANEHAALAQTYRGTRIAQASVHHDRLASLSRDAAKEAADAATMHKDLAGVAR